MQAWRTVARKTLCEPNRYCKVELHVVELPGGRRIEDWPWLITPDFAIVLARTEEGKFLCFWQTKYAIGGPSLAPVGGFIQPGEDPLAAARRELLEETGHEAREWIPLGRYVVDGNRGAGWAHLFLALGAHPVCPASLDDLEEQEPRLLSESELDRALRQGEFKVLPWCTAVALGLNHLRVRESREEGQAGDGAGPGGA